MKKIFTPLFFLFAFSAFARVYGPTHVTPEETSPCYYTGGACKTCSIDGSGDQIVSNFSAYVRMKRVRPGRENSVFSPAFFRVNITGREENADAEPPPPCPKPTLGSFVFNVQQNCGNSVITHNGNTGGHNVYWQDSPTGVSTVNLNRNHTVTRDGVYYIRARASCGTWGDAIATPLISIKRIPFASQIICPVTGVCSGSAIQFTANNNSNCSHEIAVNANPSVRGANSGTYSSTQSISQVLTNNSTIFANVVYTVTPVIYGCRGPSSTLTITVKPRPVATYTVNSPCIFSEGTVRISLSSTIPGTNFSWIAEATGSPSDPRRGSGNTIEQRVYNNGNIARHVLFSVTPSTNGCTGFPVYPIINVYPLPVIITQRTASSVNLFTYNSYPSYTWYNESGQVISSSYILTNRPSGKYRVTVGICNGQNWSADNYTIVPVPNAIIEISGCNPTRVVVKNAAPAKVSWYWQTQASGSSMQYPSTEVFPISEAKYYYLRGKAGSTWSYPQTFYITPTPVPSVFAPDYSICSGNNIEIDLSSHSTTTTRNDFTVQSNGVSGAQSGSVANISNFTIIRQTLTNTSTSPKTVVYTITPANSSCTGNPVTSTVTVNPRPVIPSAPMQYVFSGNYLTLPLSSNIANTTYFWSVLTPTLGVVAK